MQLCQQTTLGKDSLKVSTANQESWSRFRHYTGTPHIISSERLTTSLTITLISRQRYALTTNFLLPYLHHCLVILNSGSLVLAPSRTRHEAENKILMVWKLRREMKKDGPRIVKLEWALLLTMGSGPAGRWPAGGSRPLASPTAWVVPTSPLFLLWPHIKQQTPVHWSRRLCTLIRPRPCAALRPQLIVMLCNELPVQRWP